MNILDYVKKNYLIFDGAMGSLLQQKTSLVAGALPESLNISDGSLIEEIHYNYLTSGANVVLTNTFGANPIKYLDQEYTLAQVIEASIRNARQAVNRVSKDAFVAYDIGPLGQLLKPSGTLSFEAAYEAFSEVVIEANKGEIDVFVIETISDLYEAKAAVLAVKEHSDKPVFCTLTFQENHRTLVGNDIKSMVATLEGLRVDALGINCSFGPKEMIVLVKEIAKYASIPLMVQPNAGMPILNGEELNYDIDAATFLTYMKEIIAMPVQIVGGCCGTTYVHIKLLAQYLENTHFVSPCFKEATITSSGMKAITFDKEVIKVGERINPTGKKDLTEAYLNQDYSYVIKEALAQEEEGAHVLDINAGIPKADETALLVKNIEQIQAYTKLPLQIDSSNPDAIAAALRVYNGKAIVNSVNGKQSNLDMILPSVAKYGGLIIGLCLDEAGLAFSVEHKVKVAQKIVNEAAKYGIDKKDIIIDALTLTASAQQEDVKATLDAITIIKEKLGVKTTLGASNVSFGLPNRDVINASFLSMAIYAGLDACIVNPASQAVNNAIMASEVLLDKDHDSTRYIASVQENKHEEKTIETLDLQTIIVKGFKDEAMQATKDLLVTRDPFDIIENEIVKALDYVGSQFENKQLFLPQLIQSAQTVSIAFEEIKKAYPATDSKVKHRIILATVQGDVHDIGKNIVKVLLENYGYDVIDLGKDVSSATIIERIKQDSVKLVGLSALMSTTVVNMEQAIKDIHDESSDIKVMVGGAVLTSDYASKIDADYYCKDALEGVEIAKLFFK